MTVRDVVVVLLVHLHLLFRRVGVNVWDRGVHFLPVLTFCDSTMS